MIETVRKIVHDSLDLKKSFFASNEARIVDVARVLYSALESGGKILLFGNGGSAADAQHIACEWIGRFQGERGPLPAIALTTDSSALTAIGNDYGFSRVFARQLQALGRKGDVAVGISTSGNSENVLEAVRAANGAGLVTVGLTGGDGGRLASEARHCLNVPHASAPRIQETHIMIGHVLCALVEEQMKGPR
ncbi:MAG: D-sedoheptulose 7-phosphate isomerase [Acidobacteria bacterium]|nr:D-sedoheptulose 7-phosphate isomerase [Acidobacteriota bacterium]